MDNSQDVIVCCIAKREQNYIREFVEHNFSIGFDRVVIGDNDEQDSKDTPVAEILKDYIASGKVKIVDLRGQKAQQMPFYNRIMKEEPYSWCAFLDVDEFIAFNRTGRFKNIKEFLNYRPNIRGYKLQWLMYGDNGQCRKTGGKLVDRFPTPLPHTTSANQHTKSILKKGFKGVFQYNPHTVACRGGDVYHMPDGRQVNSSAFNTPFEYSEVYIKHYYTKSLEEWIDIKMKRGYADHTVVDKRNVYPITMYFSYNEKTPEKEQFLKEHGFSI